ncbi:hypothetical protein V1291_004577 [Nitrobacteraceae bacterium AZCC 1564]
MYLQPNGPTAEDTLQEILRILDHQVVVQAEFLLLHRLLRQRLVGDDSSRGKITPYGV